MRTKWVNMHRVARPQWEVWLRFLSLLHGVATKIDRDTFLSGIRGDCTLEKQSRAVLLSSRCSHWWSWCVARVPCLSSPACLGHSVAITVQVPSSDRSQPWGVREELVLMVFSVEFCFCGKTHTGWEGPITMVPRDQMGI